jgi:CHAD domain-containing protein
MSDTEPERGSRSAAPPTLHAYAVEAIATRLERMLSHLEGVRKSEELEPVHQMRVWSRRTRAALEVFEGCFPRKAFASIEREVKAAADALGEARDLDVMIESLSHRAEALPVAQRTGLESFVQKLKANRAARQMAVTQAIERLERQDLKLHFDRLSAEPSPAADRSLSPRAGRKRDPHG